VDALVSMELAIVARTFDAALQSALMPLARFAAANRAGTGAPVLARLAEAQGIAMPIAAGVAALLDGTVSPRALVAQLLARPLRAEAALG
jgi:glycerol-3-phosphate dehydrogenase (NAD(P)+)